MIKAVDLLQNQMSFKAKQSKKQKVADDETRILPNNLQTRLHQGAQKVESAFVDYPVKGLRGDVNSSFYEFLTMGIVPYLVGSGMFMFVFNCVNKHLDANSQKYASKYGKKMALGVVLYGVMKTLSKSLVTKPVKAATGVDTEMPYQNKYYPLPKERADAATIIPHYEQRKIFDSKEFYRKDLLDREYFDGIAKKLGLGEDLNDSVSETSPIIQNIVATTNTAKSLSSYSWAAVGVGLAMQDSWMSFFDSISNRSRFTAKEGEAFSSKLERKLDLLVKNTKDISKELVVSFARSVKSLWTGRVGDSGFMKHSGKLLIGFATIVTTLLTANAINRAKSLAKNSNLNTIDKSKESTVI